MLTEFGASALNFEIFCIVAELVERGRIKSDIHFAILRAFRAAGIDMTPPQDVRLIGGAGAAEPRLPPVIRSQSSPHSSFSYHFAALSADWD